MYIFLLLLIFLIPSEGLTEGRGIAGRPDSHAPISVMGDHNHKKGDLMFSYRYMRMEMSDLRDATHDISRTETVSSSGSYKFMNAPIKMHTNMHMFGAMYGINNQLTAMLMAPYIEKKMEVRQRAGDMQRFSVESRGLGDIKLTGLLSIKEEKNSKWLFNFGLSIPTGETNIKDVMVMMNGNHSHSTLGYGMQLGSGTYDPILKLGYTKKWDNFSLGFQTSGVWRLYQNSNNYHLGDEYQGIFFSAFNISEWISLSGKIDGKWRRKISGAHKKHTNMLMSPAFSKDQGNRKINFGSGINFIIPKGKFKGNRFALEYLTPIYQYHDGLQMKSDGMLYFGWQYALNLKDLF